ncbi:MAG TPA: hypothetical protein PK777_08560 [Thermoguttaceae bacterium]|nr:hypothetical protein [Thermoguttaceae bacterium]
MPIRFRCVACRQLLSIGRRKAGAEIQCPKCGRSQVVPNQEEAAAALAAETAHHSSEPSSPAPSGIFIFDEEPEEENWSSSPIPSRWNFSSGGQTAPSATAESQVFSGLASEGSAFPSPSQEVIWISRRTLYLQALLIFVVGAVGFVLGYWLGWADSPAVPQLAGEQPAAPLVVEGRLFYRPEPLQVAADEGAIAIFLPADRTPEQRFVTFGIRPQDPFDDAHPTVRAIQHFGGAYTRTDAEGNFLVQLPKEGSYYVLFISRHARRPDASIPDPLLQEMKAYFTEPRNLIEKAKFHWTRQTVRFPMPSMEHDFDR